MNSGRAHVMKIAQDIHKMVNELEEDLGFIADPEVLEEIQKISQG